jgi:glycosyltransferase involved in cell wall biosynthesis
LRRPKKYVSTLFSLVTRRHPTLFSYRRTLWHFNQGIYAAYVLRHNPGDHLHAHFLNQCATIAFIISRMLGIPYSVTVHASGDLYSSPFMIREKLAGAKFIATCTEYNRDYLTRLGKTLFDSKLIVHYHGLDPERYRRSSPMPSKQPVILSVGQLMERKGFIYLVRACQILKERGALFNCRIVGEGPLRGPLGKEIRRLGLEGQVELTGALPQEEIIRQYEEANLFTLPAVLAENGDRDGIPNVILEAMAMELPIVSTWHSGVPEVIQDGKNGLLVPPQDSARLADALQFLLSHREIARTLGLCGRQTVLEKFNPQTNIQKLLQAFLA